LPKKHPRTSWNKKKQKQNKQDLYSEKTAIALFQDFFAIFLFTKGKRERNLQYEQEDNT